MMAKTVAIALAVVAAATAGRAQDGIMAPGAEMTKLASDFRFTEGPAADAKGDIYFTDIPNNRILKWSIEAGQLSTFREDSGG
ncbi:MAG: SMP-30/gluconolactonase/LRE family protein, partial [Planctomycetes bacterium]|nr:SMP-30/gluconolactonase/LRE family protein [Planctomycetota bacterium]